MRNARFVWVVFYALAVTLVGCRAPSKDWNGSWKMDVQKSRFQSHAITISISPDGEYRYDDGFVNITFRCDGVYRPIGNNRTQAWVKSSATTLDSTRMENGVKVNTYHWELSADGKVLTTTATSYRPSGPVIMGQLVATRTTGSNDFAGEWKDVHYRQSGPELTLRLDRQFLHISYPNSGSYIDAPLTGDDAPEHGVHTLDGVTYAVRIDGPRQIFILVKRDGKALTQSSLELSGDGRVITESQSTPGHPAEKGTLVYERQ
jgi:hypothetical protein